MAKGVIFIYFSRTEEKKVADNFVLILTQQFFFLRELMTLRKRLLHSSVFLLFLSEIDKLRFTCTHPESGLFCFR